MYRRSMCIKYLLANDCAIRLGIARGLQQLSIIEPTRELFGSLYDKRTLQVLEI